MIKKDRVNNIKYNYKFKYDYFYALGDNSKYSTDSRLWGLIQNDHIVGKVVCVLFSKNKGKFRWNRILKSIY